MKNLASPILMIALGIAGAAASNHGPATSVLGSLILAGFGVVVLFCRLFSSLDEGPENASGTLLSAGDGVLGLETKVESEPAAPTGQSQAGGYEAQQESVDTPVQAAVRGLLIESIRKAPVVIEEPYACLEILLRELPDGAEVRSVVAAVRTGVANTLRTEHAVESGDVDSLAAKLCESEAIPVELAHWSVRTWAEAFRAAKK